MPGRPSNTPRDETGSAIAGLVLIGGVSRTPAATGLPRRSAGPLPPTAHQSLQSPQRKPNGTGPAPALRRRTEWPEEMPVGLGWRSGRYFPVTAGEGRGCGCGKGGNLSATPPHPSDGSNTNVRLNRHTNA
jgi:hypothetical protein